MQCADVATYLELALSPKGLEERAVIQEVAHLVSDQNYVLPQVGSVRRSLRLMGLPSPSRWRALGRVVGLGVALQTEAHPTIAQACRPSGFANGSSASHTCRRLLGVPPRDLRATLGWEWLLARFLRRCSS